MQGDNLVLFSMLTRSVGSPEAPGSWYLPKRKHAVLFSRMADKAGKIVSIIYY